MEPLARTLSRALPEQTGLMEGTYETYESATIVKTRHDPHGTGRSRIRAASLRRTMVTGEIGVRRFGAADESLNDTVRASAAEAAKGPESALVL